ncbi:hypothetical protein H0H87_010786 [Tephrocybe sp. NHM501043]|nr:hypothetical protein H0H87_010786 [Tephrocybe sp. NHM501043]
MLSLTSFALAVTAFTSVTAVVVPRATAPAGWATNYLEAGQKAATTLPSKCLTSVSSSTTAVTPAPTTTDDDDYCYEGDEDCVCDGEDTSTSTVVTTTKTPATTPTVTPTKTPLPTTTSPKTTTKKTSTTPATTSTTRVEPTPAAADTNSGGFATYFYQNGVAGACGTVHKDSDFIAAMDKDRYGNLNVKSALCGKQVKITNPANKKSVTVTIADACPTCKNSNSIDLSEGAFKQIATLEQGMVGITWSFV